MIPIKLEKLSSKALELFADAKKAFAGASSLHNRGRAMAVPTSFVDEDKKLSIVFVGSIAQVSPRSYLYSRGKSWKWDKALPQKDVTIWTGME